MSVFSPSFTRFAIFGAMALYAGLALTGASAQTTDTMERIAKTHVINMGVRDASPPFSTINKTTKKAVGYSIDICYKMLENMQKELKMPDLRFQEVVVTANDRIGKIKNGTIDMECGSTVITKARLQELDFGYAILFGSQRLLSARRSNITSQINLAGKTVAVIKGSTGEKVMQALKARDIKTVNIVAVTSNEEALAALESGKVQAISQLDVILHSMRLRSKMPDAYVVSEWPTTVEPIAFPVRKNDTRFRTLINNSIRTLYNQPDFKNIYAKWFGVPGKPVQFSALMLENLRNPNADPGMAFIPGIEL